MSPEPADDRFSLAKTEPETPFRIVAVYDSDDSSAEAARASAVVMRELGEEVPIDRSSWAVSALESSLVCDAAAAEAARADMIVVALSQQTQSQALREWVKQWQQNRSGGGLLALIPSCDASSAADLEQFFYETSVTASMDFLCRKENRF